MLNLVQHLVLNQIPKRVRDDNELLMCRFLIAKSTKPIRPSKILEAFASMAKKGKAFDGDWQGDGWGIAWMSDDSTWKIYKSLSPIWEEEKKFEDFPETNLFAIHARSASFPQHKNNLEFNQPYISDSTLFVFNGLLKGVRLPFSVSGTIGTQKIWALLQDELKNKNPKDALNKVKDLLIKHMREIQALNIGMIYGGDLFSVNYFTKLRNYYTLQRFFYKTTDIICSEKLKELEFNL